MIHQLEVGVQAQSFQSVLGHSILECLRLENLTLGAGTVKVDQLEQGESLPWLPAPRVISVIGLVFEISASIPITDAQVCKALCVIFFCLFANLLGSQGCSSTHFCKLIWLVLGGDPVALRGSSSSLHSEACNALGVSDGAIHSRISWEATSLRAVANCACHDTILHSYMPSTTQHTLFRLEGENCRNGTALSQPFTLASHTFSAFKLWSSVVSVLISGTTDMPPTGDLLVTSNFAGEVSSWAFLGAFTRWHGTEPVAAHPMG